MPRSHSLVLVLGFLVLFLAGCSGGGSGGTSGTTAQAQAPTLQTLTLSPSILLVPGATLTLTATGGFSDGSTATLNNSAITWSSSNPLVATVSSAGVVTALAPGSTTIQGTVGAVVGQQAYTVSGNAVVSLAVTPSPASVAIGATQQFTATATLSNGQTSNLTSVATWSSGTPAVATISATGLATGVTTGNSTIAATAFGVSGSAQLGVTAPTIVSLQVLTNPALVTPNGNRQLACFATMSDGSRVNVSASVTWSSADTNVATVNGTGLVTGGATAGATTTITAQHATAGSSSTELVVEDYLYFVDSSGAAPFRLSGAGVPTFSPGLFLAPFTFVNSAAYLHPNGTHLFGSRSTAATVQVDVRRLDPRNGRLFTEASLPMPAPVNQLAVHPTGRALYGGGPLGIAVRPLDPFRVLAEGSPTLVPAEFVQPGLAVNEAGTFLYVSLVSDQDGSTLQIGVLPLDPATGAVTGPLARVQANNIASLQGLRFSADGSRLYLTEPVGNTFRYALDPMTGLPGFPGTFELQPLLDNAGALLFNSAGTRAYARSGNVLAADYTVDGAGTLTTLSPKPFLTLPSSAREISFDRLEARVLYPLQNGVEIFTLDGSGGFSGGTQAFFPAPSTGQGFQVMRVP